ncbi:hypothetical protein M3Y98_01177000 [Aphelenchoides besseyi]|nr:hypothetical protein M3Y98_01177000 [Aphelenchoides besseyi]KAI6211028.1 hypothetical protein M3Y96_00390000 [Aphelenchoides besseyi]
MFLSDEHFLMKSQDLKRVVFAERSIDCKQLTFQLSTVTHLGGSAIALLHPVLQSIPVSWFAIQSGNYSRALVLYLLVYVNQVSDYLFVSKYLLIAIERTHAFKNRANYETEDGSKGRRIIITILAIVFYRLSHYVRLHYYAANSLSESYQIKQTNSIVRVMFPLLIAFGLLSFMAMIPLVILYYRTYILGFSFQSDESLVLINIAYICAAIYNLYCAVYIRKFHKTKS